MPKQQKILRIVLGAFSVVFLLCFHDYDVDYKNSLWNVHIAEEQLDTDFAQSYSSQLPIVYVESENSTVLTEPNESTYPRRGEDTVSIYTYYLNKDNGKNSLFTIPDQVFEYNRFKIRGRSSSVQPKRPYAIELQDENGLRVNRKFINFDKESDYVLHAPYIDKSCIRNYFTYTLASTILDYVPRAQPVELIINQKGTSVDEEDYKGIYLAVEKIKTGTNRVPIKEFVLKDTLEEQLKYGGGYIFRRDKFDESSDTALLLPMTEYYYEFQIYSPKEEELTEEAADMIYQEICFYEKVLYEGTFEELEKYFDIDSFIDMILLNELVNHSESFTGSTYFYRLPGGKLCRGPPWDYDISMGVNQHPNGMKSNLMFEKSRLERVFLHHPEFLERLKERWAEYRQEGGIFSETALFRLYDYCVETIGEDAFERNANRYPELFDGNTSILGNVNKFTSWHDELDHIKNFIVARGEYLDEVWAEITVADLPGKE